MLVSVYKWNEEEKYIDAPDKEVKSIYVKILSGDETGTIYFEDGTSFDFDANEGEWMVRSVDFFDGEYTVEGKNKIREWILGVREY